MAKDLYHDLVKEALIQQGWTITNEPYNLFFGEKRVMADLGAEKWIIAEKQLQKILVEVIMIL